MGRTSRVPVMASTKHREDDRAEAAPTSCWDRPVIGAGHGASFSPVTLMLDTLLNPRRGRALSTDPALFAAHERAAGVIARLDQTLQHHSLLPAFLHRARLEAARPPWTAWHRSLAPRRPRSKASACVRPVSLPCIQR